MLQKNESKRNESIARQLPAESQQCTIKKKVVLRTLKVSVKENEVPTEKNSSRASIFATKASYISN